MNDNQNIQNGSFPPPPPPPPPPPQSSDGDDKDEGPITPIGNFGRTANFTSKISLPKHATKVDEQHFLQLLAGSISLSIDEKKKIIENFGSLSQYQVDELIKIFEEEKSKFAALDVKHKEQLQALEKQHSIAWDSFESESQQAITTVEDKAEAEEIRKSLGLD